MNKKAIIGICCGVAAVAAIVAGHRSYEQRR